MLKFVKNKTDDILTCPVCFNQFNLDQREPRQLPCQHNICSCCLNKLKNLSPNSKSLNCPKCRGSFQSKLEDIPRSLVVCQLVELSLNQTSENVQRNNQHVKIEWDANDYLKLIFNQIDSNGDGAISANELQNMLKNVNSGSEFNPKTVSLLIRTYDLNGDNEISFDEFFNLHKRLNEDWEIFLITDADSNGTIDPNELSKMLKNKGYSLSNSFFEFFFQNFYKKTGENSLKFDMFIRVCARLEYLLKVYHNNSNLHQDCSIENYLKKKFFLDFF